MIITNNQGLPRALVEAVKRDTHKGADYSASALTKSPRALWLERRHGDEITKDASEMVWALFGSAVHAVLERADNEHRLTEEYLTAEIAGKTLSATTGSSRTGRPQASGRTSTLTVQGWMSTRASLTPMPTFSGNMGSCCFAIGKRARLSMIHLTRSRRFSRYPSSYGQSRSKKRTS